MSVSLLTLALSTCGVEGDASSPPEPVIVSITDSAGVDDAVQFVVYIPSSEANPERATLVIDWGDDRPHYERIDIDVGFHYIASHRYFDPGEYQLRCRSENNRGRISSWTEPQRVRIGGFPTMGLGDWWMYMRDAAHSGHSNFAGPSRGRLLARHALSSPIRSSAAFDIHGTAHIGTDGFRMMAMYQDLGWKWEYNSGTGQLRSSPLLRPDGGVIFGSNSANVYALDRRGIKVWSTSVNAPIGFSSPAPLPNEGVVLGCMDGRVIALNADGSQRWFIIAQGAVRGSPAVGNDGTVYFGSEDQILYAVDGAGRIRWTVPTEAAIQGSPSIAADGSIIFGNDAGWLYSLRSDGLINWRRSLHHPIQGTPATSRDARILCVTTNGDLVSLNLQGVEEWRTSFAMSSSACNAILDVYGTAYIGGPDGVMSAFDRAGRLLWRFETDAAINSTAAIGQRGELIFGNDRGFLYILGD